MISAERGGVCQTLRLGSNTFLTFHFVDQTNGEPSPDSQGKTLPTPPWEELKVTLQRAWMQEDLTNISVINLALNLVRLHTYFINKVLSRHSHTPLFTVVSGYLHATI